jgi:HK97 family phage prohead protease
MTGLREGYRAVPTNIYDLDDAAHKVAVSLPHETLDSYGTDFQAGCFKESFERHLPDMLGEHDPSQHLGHAVRAEVRSQDNLIIGQFDPFDVNPTAARYFRDLQDGRVKNWSFWFREGEYVRHPHVPNGLRYVKATMEEFSATKRPAIPGTRTLGIRSALDTRSNVASELRALFTRMEINSAADRSQAMLRQQLRQTGQLPRRVRSACYDAVTRSEERFADLIDEVGAALDRADRNRRGR